MLKKGKILIIHQVEMPGFESIYEEVYKVLRVLKSFDFHESYKLWERVHAEKEYEILSGKMLNKQKKCCFSFLEYLVNESMVKILDCIEIYKPIRDREEYTFDPNSGMNWQLLHV